MSDPKGKLVKKQEVNTSLKHIPHKKSIIRAQNYHKTTEQMAAEQFLSTRPYEEDTVFGYTTLIDTNREIKAKVFPTNQPWAENLEAGEEMMIDYLIDGSFFSHTGYFILTLLILTCCYRVECYISNGFKALRPVRHLIV